MLRLQTLEDLGIDRSSEYNLTAPNAGGLKPSSSNSNLPVGSSNLISTSPGISPAGTPTHAGNSNSAWGGPPTPSPKPSPASTPTRSSQPSAQALYDFEAENPGELSFKEGDIIMLKNQIDENWYDGSLNGRSGYFPVTYVNVVVPLP
jgi:endophilin-A